MDDARPFAWLIGLPARAVLLAILANRLSDRIGVPAPALFLVAAVVSDLFPALGQLSPHVNERVVTFALIFLFDGDIHIGWRPFRVSAGAVVWIGVAGTVVAAAVLAVLAHVFLVSAETPRCRSAPPCCYLRVRRGGVAVSERA